ncbi:hypothetical protein PR048_021491 [Dryococelus australis]|uniref:Zinc finger BED domain-containing protein 4 n=1 Tax=Dryococelus australis TaxID=614101 RepID=A0ABQ9GYC7_9NEOP|nr:hypothetical protein PR048_021491 [Dryococelus australis]
MHFVNPKKMSAGQRNQLDNHIFKLFTLDFQPFSIVEDKGYSNYCKVLNPTYTLPSRKMIISALNVESYLDVTSHYINKSFELKSLLLQCSSMPVTHTSVSLAEEIRSITDKYNISNKVLAVVTDNANNIKVVKPLIDKIKTIVSHFKRSCAAMEKLVSAQKTAGRNPKKLIHDVPIRWNSKYYMVQRLSELQDVVKTTLVLINKGIPVLTDEEWLTCKDLTSVLKPFEEVMEQISEEKYVTGSIVIVLVNGLTIVCDK